MRRLSSLIWLSGSVRIHQQKPCWRYFQWSRAAVTDRDKQVERATISFFLDPTVGYGKQIARIISPEKFDGRPKGDFDNKFREGTLRCLKAERKKWLSQSHKDARPPH